LTAARRSGYGEGSIYQKKDGRWVAALVLSRRQRRYFYGGSREEVRRKLNQALKAIDTGTYTDSRGRGLGEFLDQWLEEVVKPSVRQWTFAGYEVHIRLHIKPTLGAIPLDELAPLDVQRWMNRKVGEGLSAKSVRYMRGTLRAALNQAIRWGMISRNVAMLGDPPRGSPYDIRPLDPDEARQFLAAIRGDRLEALYSVALALGLRQGEALGLQWRDVDLDRGLIRVVHQLQRVDSKLTLVSLKTDKSRRTLQLPASTLRGLREHHARQATERKQLGAGWHDRDLVFTKLDGRLLEGSTVTRMFHRHLDDAGLPQRRFHDLRHSCATLLLVQGVSPRVVMEVLGHSDVGMTLNTYSHVVPQLKREAADRMDEILELDR
jgi:integrase